MLNRCLLFFAGGLIGFVNAFIEDDDDEDTKKETATESENNEVGYPIYLLFILSNSIRKRSKQRNFRNWCWLIIIIGHKKIF